MVDGGLREAVGLAPGRRPPVKLLHQLRLAPTQFCAEQLAEQMMVAVPLAAPVQRHQQQIRARQRLQDIGRSLGVQDRVAQRPGQAVQHRRARQERHRLRWEMSQELRPQIFGQEPIVAADLDLFVPAGASRLEGQGGQVQPDRPTFGPPDERGRLCLGQLHPRTLQQGVSPPAGPSPAPRPRPPRRRPGRVAGPSGAAAWLGRPAPAATLQVGAPRTAPPARPPHPGSAGRPAIPGYPGSGRWVRSPPTRRGRAGPRRWSRKRHRARPGRGGSRGQLARPGPRRRQHGSAGRSGRCRVGRPQPTPSVACAGPTGSAGSSCRSPPERPRRRPARQLTRGAAPPARSGPRSLGGPTVGGASTPPAPTAGLPGNAQRAADGGCSAQRRSS